MRQLNSVALCQIHLWSVIAGAASNTSAGGKRHSAHNAPSSCPCCSQACVQGPRTCSSHHARSSTPRRRTCGERTGREQGDERPLCVRGAIRCESEAFLPLSQPNAVRVRVCVCVSVCVCVPCVFCATRCANLNGWTAKQLPRRPARAPPITSCTAHSHSQEHEETVHPSCVVGERHT